jgi:hypothetical protein
MYILGLLQILGIGKGLYLRNLYGEEEEIEQDEKNKKYLHLKEGILSEILQKICIF